MIEAARIDGASELQILRHVIFPVLSGVVLTTAILAISGSLESFDLIYAMTGGNPARRTSVLALYMYDSAFTGAPNYPLANAISTFMVLFSVATIYPLVWLFLSSVKTNRQFQLNRLGWPETWNWQNYTLAPSDLGCATKIGLCSCSRRSLARGARRC